MPGVDIFMEDCPRCDYPMVPLKSFRAVSPTEAFGPDFGDMMGGLAGVGWEAVRYWLTLPAILLFMAVGAVAARIRYRFLRTRLNRLRDRVLPHHPDSRICANCFHVVRR